VRHNRNLYNHCMRPTLIATQVVRSLSYESAESIARLKKPTRGGQNLTDRHRRLERSLRGREARLKQIDDLSSASTVVQPPPTVRRPTLSTFRGFVIPEKPKPPEPDGRLPDHHVNHMYMHVYQNVQSAVCLVVRYASMIYI